MKMLNHFLDFYINSSIHVALSVLSLTWITLLEFGVLYDESLLFFVFFASILGYNFVKYFGTAKFYDTGFANWLKAIKIFSISSFVCMCYYALQLYINTILCVLGFGLITFFYAIPFFPKQFFINGKYNLRNIGGLKVYVVALVWTGVTVFLPLINNQLHIEANVLITAFQRFTFIVVLMMPFEIRDLQFDSLKLATIPQKIGLKQTKNLGLLLLVLFILLEFLKPGISGNKLLIISLVSIIAGAFLIFSKKKQNNYYSSFWVESIPIIWLIITFIL